MPFRFWHQCIACGERLEPDRFYYTCSKCSGLLLVERDEDYVKNKIGAGHAARNYFDHLRFGEARKTYPNDSGVWLFRDFILPDFPV